ncbi:anti-sigma factor domain-containing protein [Nonomuraea sp. NPDC050556]|uniref:anti-sigma factor n=1 Tax=Nonomuraea sp. NPDC050556 TaxID=3364369 RepID=UPI00378AF663
MNDTVHTLSGAYALDALPPDELRAFERHLTRCPDCESEVGTLRETAARLALAAAERPPPQLKTNVLAQIREQRQLPPKGPIPVAHRPGRQREVAAAALLVAAAVLGVLLTRANTDLDLGREREQAIAAVLAAPDARRVSTSIEGARATAIFSWASGELVFAAPDLPALPASQDYQLWAIEPGGIRSAGLVPRDPAPVLAGALQPGDRLGITIEPRGGSEQPTTPPLAVLTLPDPA